MSLFDRLFRSGPENNPHPPVKFGRYSDTYKTQEQYDAWDEALQAFENEEYLDSYRAFFRYLRDHEAQNVQLQDENGRIDFEILQGSKKVIGFASPAKLKAEAKVASVQQLNIGFMRRLVEQNFDLKYSRYALDRQNDITIVFDTYSLDGSPYKLYYALKEVATNADKQDDLLIDEFQMLGQTDNSHLRDLPEQEKEVKYAFIQEQIGRTFERIDHSKLDANQYPGAIAYLLLDLCYKLDYLTKPEGYMMEALERIHRTYFAKDGRNTAQKNHTLRKEFQKLMERPKEQFFKEMYEVTSTFGITSPVNHDKVVSFIDGELHNMDWYHEQKHYDIALSIPGYIVGYCLFNYAVPKPDRDLLHLYFQVTEPEYFQRLGFSAKYYDPASGELNKRAIKKAIRYIVDENSVEFVGLNPAIGSLNFDGLAEFAKSYLLMIRNMEVAKAV